MANIYEGMNVRQKLAKARLQFLNQKVKKSGKNMHLEFKYFELEDIVPPAIRIFARVGLTTDIDFTDENGAVMRVYNTDNSEEAPISSAGLQKGLRNEDGSKTRSGLFFDAIRIMKHCKPRIAIAENVKNLTSKRMSGVFDTVLSELEDAGYNNYWQVLNAADYGMPQGREYLSYQSVKILMTDLSIFHL